MNSEIAATTRVLSAALISTSTVISPYHRRDRAADVQIPQREHHHYDMKQLNTIMVSDGTADIVEYFLSDESGNVSDKSSRDCKHSFDSTPRWIRPYSVHQLSYIVAQCLLSGTQIWRIDGRENFFSLVLFWP